MYARRDSGTLTPVGNESTSQDRQARGQAIRERFRALGIEQREWQARTGIAPATLRRVMAGDEKVRPQTFEAVEMHLDRLEQLVGIKGNPVAKQHDLGAGMVAITVEGVYGARTITVEGPVGDIDALERMVARLLRGQQEGQESGGDRPGNVNP
jgi:hypothetical protein